MKQYCGVAPHQYIQHLKVEKAKQLLANTDHTLSLIAQEVRYNDLSVFIKPFGNKQRLLPGNGGLEARMVL